jgi:hypothetical protein
MVAVIQLVICMMESGSREDLRSSKSQRARLASIKNILKAGA